MKLIIVIMTAFLMQVSASTRAQLITLKQENASLKKVFSEIRKQTGYIFLYKSSDLEKAAPVDVNLKQSTIEDALKSILKNQQLEFSIEEKSIVVSKKEPSFLDKLIDRFDNIDVRGRVTDENGQALAGATVSVVGSNNSTKTDQNGDFYLRAVDEKATIKVSFVGYKEAETKAKKNLDIQMKTASADLEEVTVNKGYYTTKKALETGNVAKVTAAEIQSQPVTNPLLALSGRVAGLDVTQANGVPGSTVKIQIRGQSSLLNGSDPLFIIDGVPIASGNSNINNYTSFASSNLFVTAGALPKLEGGYSPFGTIDPNDIESIEILKDADATSIYGSRGANGVVLITTKRGKAGKTSVSINAYSGISKVGEPSQLLNTQQYIAMRKEAFQNDGIVPNSTPGTPGYAPDLTLWDNNRYTDFQKLLIGGNAKTTNVNASISGGSENTQFLINSGFDHGTTVFPTDMGNTKYSLSFKLDNKSSNKKFFSTLSTFYTVNKNTSFAGDLSGVLLPPNAPALYDASGKLSWQENGVSFSNPLGQFLRSYKLDANNFNANLITGYHFLDNLTLKTSIGYNQIFTNETSLVPFAAQDPSSNPVAQASFGKNNYAGLVIEPQLDYNFNLGKSKISALVGTSYQFNEQNSLTISASGYSNDSFINSLSAAPNIEFPNNPTSQYKYVAIYGRLNYNYDNRYIINFSGRRDGSSRFGPDRQYSNFAAVGAAWVFANETFVKNNLPFISTGKIRGSYGVTGNDQIGDYQFLDSYQTAPNPYQGSTAIVPKALFNPDFSWEKNQKTEIAMDLGFFKDRLNLSVSYYHNLCGNQLINYKLPSQTGFTSVVQNLNAKIENSGFELVGQSMLINSNKLNWSVSFNLTLPQSKLTAFPGLAESSYASQYVIGQSPNVIYRYRTIGVNPTTGVYAYEDIDKNGSFNSKDYQVNGILDPKYYGGLGTTLTYRNLDLSIFISGKKQTGQSYLSSTTFGDYVPGGAANQPIFILNHWQKPGDISTIQKFTTPYASSAAFTAATLSGQSDLYYTDASFLRLKNVSIGYDFTKSLPQKLKIKKARVFVLGENLFTISDYEGGDPENQKLLALPPLRTITAGIQINL